MCMCPLQVRLLVGQGLVQIERDMGGGGVKNLSYLYIVPLLLLVSWTTVSN